MSWENNLLAEPWARLTAHYDKENTKVATTVSLAAKPVEPQLLPSIPKSKWIQKSRTKALPYSLKNANFRIWCRVKL